jgi:ribosome-binding protein aMBF1 (putative translation factor)
MDGQDWKEVVLRKQNAASHKRINVVTQTIKKNDNIPMKDVDIDGKQIIMVSQELRKKFETARKSCIDPQTTKFYTRDGLAKRLSVNAKHINELESGKLSEKEAKQIALKFERILKVSLLAKN